MSRPRSVLGKVGILDMDPQSILDWAERHAGLGGWVGAIGAVIAIFVTWGLSRAEYLRTRNHEIARERAAILLLKRVLFDFDLKIMQPYFEAVVNDSALASGYYRRHFNDSQMAAMTDLAHLPVTEWPTVNSYFYFKRYWQNSLVLLKIYEQPGNYKDAIPELKREYAFLYNTVHDMLLHAYDRATNVQEGRVDDTVEISEPHREGEPPRFPRR